MAFVVLLHNRAENVPWLCVSVGEENFCAGSGSAAWTQHHPPIISRILVQQEHFDFTAACDVSSSQTRTDHARIVQNQEIVAAQIIHYVREGAMGDLSAWSVQDEQARLITAMGGVLRDEFIGQRIIEIGGAHVGL